MFKYLFLITSIILLAPLLAAAESAYVIDRIQVGIHSESKLTSPILKVIPTGTRLEIQQRGVDMSKVKDQDGVIGWINTEYLIDTAPGGTGNDGQKIQQLKAALSRSETEVKQLKSDLSNVNNIQEGKELKSMKLKIAELEAKLSAEKKTTKSTNSNSTTKELEAIKQKNVELEQTVTRLKNQTATTAPLTNIDTDNNSSSIVWLISISILVGIVLGIFLFDFYKRRQHGGFRV